MSLVTGEKAAGHPANVRGWTSPLCLELTLRSGLQAQKKKVACLEVSNQGKTSTSQSFGKTFYI